MNLATIFDLNNNKPVGVIATDYSTGDIAYFALPKDLITCLDIITDNPIFFSYSEKIGESTVIKKEEVTPFDSYYLLAINYNLPSPWEIKEVEVVHGDVEDVIEIEASKLYKEEMFKNE